MTRYAVTGGAGFIGSNIVGDLVSRGHEVIVIDDCSPTDLAPVVADFDGTVQYERLKANSGANVARNRGISLAAGDLVAFLDDDDIWMPEKLEQQIAEMGSDAEACLCGFGFIGESKERLQPIHTVTQDILRQGNHMDHRGLDMAGPSVWQRDSEVIFVSFHFASKAY